MFFVKKTLKRKIKKDVQKSLLGKDKQGGRGTQAASLRETTSMLAYP